MEGIVPTLFQTVQTYHAAAAVYLVLRNVYAGGFAPLLAQMAITAFVLVYDRGEQAEPGKKAQNRTYRTDCIATDSAAFPAKE